MGKDDNREKQLIDHLTKVVKDSDASAEKVIKSAIRSGVIGSIGCVDQKTKVRKVEVAGGAFKLMELGLVQVFLYACDALRITAELGVHRRCAWIFIYELNFDQQLELLKQIVDEHNSTWGTNHQIIVENCGSAPR